MAWALQIRKANISSGDKDHLLVFAGTGVADVKEIRTTSVGHYPVDGSGLTSQMPAPFHRT